MTPSPARPGALLRAPALRPPAAPRLRAQVRAAAGAACVVLLGLLVALVLAPGGVPFLGSVTSRPSVGLSVQPDGAGVGSPAVAGADGRPDAAARSLR